MGRKVIMRAFSAPSSGRRASPTGVRFRASTRRWFPIAARERSMTCGSDLRTTAEGRRPASLQSSIAPRWSSSACTADSERTNGKVIAGCGWIESAETTVNGVLGSRSILHAVSGSVGTPKLVTRWPERTRRAFSGQELIVCLAASAAIKRSSLLVPQQQHCARCEGLARPAGLKALKAATVVQG